MSVERSFGRFPRLRPSLNMVIPPCMLPKGDLLSLQPLD